MLDPFTKRALEFIKDASRGKREWRWTAGEFMAITGLTLQECKLVFYTLRAEGWFQGDIIRRDGFPVSFQFEKPEW